MRWCVSLNIRRIRISSLVQQILNKLIVFMIHCPVKSCHPIAISSKIKISPGEYEISSCQCPEPILTSSFNELNISQLFLNRFSSQLFFAFFEFRFNILSRIENRWIMQRSQDICTILVSLIVFTVSRKGCCRSLIR